MKNKILITITLFLTTFFSCKKEVVKTNNIYKFKEYISYTTSGLVSKTESININFNKEVENWKANEELSKDLVTIKPYVEGKLKVINKSAILFIPDENLDSNTEYSVTINLGKIYTDIPIDFKQYTFQFKTIEPNFSINTKTLQSYNKEFQYLEGSLKSDDIITLEEAKQIINAKQENEKRTIIWNEAYKTSRIFNFKIDSIQRFENDSELLLSWNGDVINADNSGDSKLTIPGKNNFKVISVNAVSDPEEYISINFSDELKPQQNFDGLVKIDGEKNPKFIVNGNELQVFSSSKFDGDITVNIFEGIRNTFQYKLKNSSTNYVTFQKKKPEIRAISSGVILPNSNNLVFNFEAINVKEVDVRIIKVYENNILQFLQEDNLNSNSEYNIKKVGRRISKETITLVENENNYTQKWRAYSVDISKMIATEPGALYRIELSFKKNQAIFDCSETNVLEEEDTNYYSENTTEEEREELYWDNKLYDYRSYNYNWRERNNPCHETYYTRQILAQNLLASNLGVIAKKGANESYTIAVTDILTTQPISGANVQLYNFQQQEIEKGNTNSEGIISINSKSNAAFAIVSKNNSKAYIKLFDGNSLSLSKFDVSGSKTQKGLKGYIYGERGVWRPGDTIHLTFMLNDADNKLPKEHPVKLEVADPSRKLIYKKVTSSNVNKFYHFKVVTNADAKTGNYNAQINVGGAKFYKTLKVETVKPNRLKIKLDFDDEILTNSKPIKGTLDVKWLHGAPAKNIKAEIKAKVSSTNYTFKKYKKYTFTDPTQEFYPEEINLFEGKLNAEGIANINNDLKIGKNAPGMLNVQFLIRAFENGGDFSMDAFTKKYAPYNSFVGLKSPESKRNGSFYTDENKEFSIISVDENGAIQSNRNLELEVYKIEWRWWWSSSYDNLSKYTSSNYYKPYKTQKLKTNKEGKTSFTLNIPDEESGRYLIRVKDVKSGHATGRTAYFYKNWWDNNASQNKEAAKILVFNADKENYNVGEIAKITFPSGSEGRALISIENGTKVLKTKWVETKKGTTTIDLEITKQMTPNVYVNISLLQPHKVTENDLPIRLYGVIPIMVQDENTKLIPEIKMPKELAPEKEFEVTVSEKNGKGMTYTLAVVEEGLLDLTRFKTPNAYNSFYAREALGVKTWDIFDDIIGAYAGNVDGVFEIGGDGSATNSKKQKANRFKPVVKFLGPFYLPNGVDKKHKITLPNYIGSVRTMVVAGDVKTNAFGKAEKTTLVKKPLMVLATLPRKLSPQEKVKLPVSIFTMDKKIKEVNVQIRTAGGLKILGDIQQKLSFSKPDEKMLYFNLDASQASGINTLEILATAKGEIATYKVELDVNNPNPISSRVIDQELKANTSKSIEFNTFGEQGTNEAIIEFSTIPNLNFSGRLEYLIQYPHGCVEQTTSSVFPQLFMNDIFDLTNTQKSDIQTNIEKAIARLGDFQKANGGFSYWQGENYISDWGTSYAGHFLIEAGKKGYVLPLTFKNNFIKYQKEAARNWNSRSNGYSYDLNQAYRLYTLALIGSPDLSAMNRLREFKNLTNEAKWRLAATYALVGQQEAAEAIIKKATYEFAGYNAYNYGSITRNKAMALETMLLTGDENIKKVADDIAQELSSNKWMSTQTTAYALLSIGKMVVKNGGKSINVTYTLDGKIETISTGSSLTQRPLQILDGKNSLSINNNGNNLIYARIINKGKLPIGKELAEQRGLKVKIDYLNLQGNKIDVKTLKQGEDFVAKITVRNSKNENLNDIALTQIFPSGWEIVNTRFTDFGSTVKSEARYTDIKDDRVNFYFDLKQKRNSAETKTFTVLLNAAYLGDFYLPGIQVEAMYDNDYAVRTKGTWVKVVK